MSPILPLDQRQALELAGTMMRDLDKLKASEAKGMFVVLVWFLSELYKRGYEVTLARGEESPRMTDVTLPFPGEDVDFTSYSLPIPSEDLKVQ